MVLNWRFSLVPLCSGESEPTKGYAMLPTYCGKASTNFSLTFSIPFFLVFEFLDANEIKEIEPEDIEIYPIEQKIVIKVQVRCDKCRSKAMKIVAVAEGEIFSVAWEGEDKDKVQKIVIKVQVRCNKCRSKVMKIAAEEDGVISVAWEGEDKDKVVVIGDGVDAATLARNLSKKLGFADLLLVEEVKEKKEEKKEKENEKKDPEPPSSLECQFYKSVVVYEDDCTSPCNIM
ncbi:hypothetical protein EZV62_008918 [Acer yangbiense]|uniref:HMA domain-containing protein n=1 Tax=Acer yangbiense TaxID=1000413 RepID=A0A5C7IEF3_9ROSI|nr:hypothetical protein EZV62_008918 [Acer yangbiense]